MSKKLPPCPKCGYAREVTIAATYTQAYIEIFDDEGVYLEATEPLYSRTNRRSREVVRCGRCKKIRRDLMFGEEGEIVAVTHE